MAAAAAMAFDIQLDDLIKVIGHDGSDVLNNLPDPGCRKGFHMQEIVDAGLALGFSLTLIEARPIQLHIGEKEHSLDRYGLNEDRFMYYLNNYDGIIIGKARRYWHAVAWLDNKILDPQGRIYDIEKCRISIQSFWVIKSNQS